MLISFIIIALYLFCAGVLWLAYRKQQLLSWQQVMFFFVCKIAAGCVYGYVFAKVYGGDDTWGLNNDSLLQYQRLVESPGLFFSDLFSQQPIPNDPAFYFHPLSYAENLEFSILTKVMAPFNFISGGNYFINVVFFNFVTFHGTYLLYKILVQTFDCNRKVLAVVLFLFPSAAFWLSGIRVEGFLLLLTGILLYHFSQWITKRSILSLLACIVAFGFLFLMRNGYALLFVPALAGWWASSTNAMRSKKVFAVLYTTMIILVLAGSYFLPSSLNPLSIVAQRQHDFLQLEGNTRFNLTALEGNTVSFLKVLPEAFLNSFIRPFPWEAKGMLQWFVAVESIVVLFIVLLAFTKFSYRAKEVFHHPLAWALLYLVITNYLLIGFTVPFAGTIVRYRVIPEVLLLAACTLAISGKRVRRKI
jgi:hypothetical protein